MMTYFGDWQMDAVARSVPSGPSVFVSFRYCTG